jgi:hypothetical protein
MKIRATEAEKRRIREATVLVVAGAIAGAVAAGFVMFLRWIILI